MKKLNDLSKEEKRILAAEACGYKWFTDTLGHRILSPDYGNDLDAMHEAEKSEFFSAGVPASRWERYDEILHSICGGFGRAHATASQRLNAFLLAKGLCE